MNGSTGTLPAIIEAQKIMAAGLREFTSAKDNPEGYALTIAEALHNQGLDITWREIGDNDGLRQETTSAREANATDKTASDEKEAT